MLLVTPVCPVTSEGDDESWAHGWVQPVPSSTDDRDPDDDETGGDKKPPLPTTSRRRKADRPKTESREPTTKSTKPVSDQTQSLITHSDRKPRTDHKADSEGADGGLGKEGARL